MSSIRSLDRKYFVEYTGDECPVCMEVPLEPYGWNPCGHLGCRECLLKLNGCPICRALAHESQAKILPHQEAHKRISQSAIKCTNGDGKCGFRTQAFKCNDLHVHMDTKCDLGKVACQYCGEKKLLRGQLERHHKEACQVTCVACRQKVMLSDGKHKDVCKVKCPICGDVVLHKDLGKHVADTAFMARHLAGLYNQIDRERAEHAERRSELKALSIRCQQLEDEVKLLRSEQKSAVEAFEAAGAGAGAGAGAEVRVGVDGGPGPMVSFPTRNGGFWFQSHRGNPAVRIFGVMSR